MQNSIETVVRLLYIKIMAVLKTVHLRKLMILYSATVLLNPTFDALMTFSDNDNVMMRPIDFRNPRRNKKKLMKVTAAVARLPVSVLFPRF